jgi:pilus assembly protein CpaB
MNGFRWLLTVFGVTLCACGDPTVALMAAGQDLDEGTELDKNQVVEVKVSRVLATSNAVRPDAFQPLVGKRLRIPARKGDLLLASYFEVTNPAISALVVKKARAVTLSVSGAENLHLADHVDLLAAVRDPVSNEWVATTQAQNVIVLSPGKLEPAPGGEAFPLRRVTFLLLPEEAEVSLVAVRLGGLHVMVRNPEDLDVRDERGRATVNTVLSGERNRALEALRSRVQAERGDAGTGDPVPLPALPQPHVMEPPAAQESAPVPVLPGKQTP